LAQKVAFVGVVFIKGYAAGLGGVAQGFYGNFLPTVFGKQRKGGLINSGLGGVGFHGVRF